MSTTLTLKNIPLHVHRGLKAQARRHKRSLNQEAILCLEQALAQLGGERPSLASPPPPVSAGALLQSWNSRAEMLGDFLDKSSGE